MGEARTPGEIAAQIADGLSTCPFFDTAETREDGGLDLITYEGERFTLPPAVRVVDRFARSVGRTVADSGDDRPVPVYGRITGVINPETVYVAWGAERDKDEPAESVEYTDSLRLAD